LVAFAAIIELSVVNGFLVAGEVIDWGFENFGVPDARPDKPVGCTEFRASMAVAVLGITEVAGDPPPLPPGSLTLASIVRIGKMGTL
jgi:hypothetical protein